MFLKILCNKVYTPFLIKHFLLIYLSTQLYASLPVWMVVHVLLLESAHVQKATQDLSAIDVCQHIYTNLAPAALRAS